MSRQATLARIREALRTSSPPHLFPQAGETAAPYERRGALSAVERIALFEHRLHDYDARTFHCELGQLAATVSTLLRASGRKLMAAPPGIPEEWLANGVSWALDEGLSYEELNRVDGVLTAASAAVAVSGSIVLQHGPREGRRVLTLLPDYHLCILFADQIVETLPEAFERLATNGTRPITFISGPSATSDIEMTRIKGVHGPRSLDVIIVDAA